MTKLKIIENGIEKEFKVQTNQRLFEILKNEYPDFKFPCGGNISCCNCKVKVLDGNTSFTKKEEIKIGKEFAETNIRLACCINISNDMTIDITK